MRGGDRPRPCCVANQNGPLAIVGFVAVRGCGWLSGSRDVDDDSQLNKILISLGAEDVQLKHLPDALGKRESLACQIGPKFKRCTRTVQPLTSYGRKCCKDLLRA
jgi:hypothetical protein